ncbi:GxxExxY protein [Larkinella terrae]|uniref:GxxExxY protein n=2 Tax=Larkinella terrae TaxID=2025311 RepID=A0A7K0ERH6_9BACT|nr:GxxExxY protein [Larkinella terrae]
MEDRQLSYQIIKGAIEVHRALGPGLLESAYQECLQYELSEYGLYVEREKPMPIVYKEVRLNHGYRMDLLVEGRIVVETKTVEALTDVHFAQLLTYLKLGQFRLGLLINFHVTLLKEGVSRVLNPELKNSA